MTTVAPAPKLYRVQEIADALRLHITTVYRHIDSGELEVVRLGSSPKARIRITEEALERFLHERD